MTTLGVPRPSGPASAVTTPPARAVVPSPHDIVVDLPLDPVVSDYDSCFGCGVGNTNGIRLRRTGFADTVLEAEFEVSEAHQGAPGLAHGGVLAASMDEALGMAAWHLGRRFVTGRLETDFLNPVPVGATVYVRAWCTGLDGRKAYMEGEACVGAPDGPLAVRAAGLFIEVPKDHFLGGA